MAPCLETPIAYKLGSLMVPFFCFGILAKICSEFMISKQSKRVSIKYLTSKWHIQEKIIKIEEGLNMNKISAENL